jgi:MATE family multidrug resistance protein
MSHVPGSHVQLGSGSPVREELKALFRLATPLALAHAGQATMGLVDTAVVGRLSDVAQGAVGLGSGLCFAFGTLGIGVMLAFDPLVSQAIGAGHVARARTLFWQAIWMAVIAGVVLAAPLWLSPLLLEPCGVEPAVAQGAAEYVAWRVPQLMAFLLFMAARTYLQSNGRAGAIFVSMLLANVANLGLDILLVFGAGPIPPLGIAGASVATTICTWMQLLVLLFALGPAPEGSSRKLDVPVLKQALNLGLPIGLQLLAEVGIFVLAGVFAGGLGRTAVAAHTIALTWASFSFTLAVGIGSAAATRVGWAIGAGSATAARRSGLVAIAAGTAWMVASAMVFLIAPRALARAMSPDPAVIDVTVALLGVAAVFQISDGLQAVGSGALRGTGDTRFSFVANVVGHWLVGAPVALYCGIHLKMGVVGLWWGLSAGLTAVAIALVVRFFIITKRPLVALAST